MNKNFRLSVFSSLRYNSAAKIFDALFAIIFGITMARILDPSVFGLLAIASIFTGISAIFIDFGTGDAVIRHDEKKINNQFLSSIFWFNTLIGVFVSIILILLSGFIAQFFEKIIIQKIITIFSLNIIFAAMSIVPRSIIKKKLDFKSIFYERIIILPISGIAGIKLALDGYGLWSIVLQQIIVVTGGTLLIIHLSKWRPSFSFNISHINDIFHFSSYLSGTKILNYFTKKGDLFLIGKFIGDYQLGIYSKGYQLTVKMLKTINGIAIGVLFPSISKFKNDQEKLKSSFLRVSEVMFSIYGFIFLIGLLYSEVLVSIILGHKWKDLSPMIPIFLLLALFFGFSSIGSHYLKALGRTKTLFKIIIFTSIFTMLSFIIGISWGIIGVASGYLISTMLLSSILIFKSAMILNINIKNYLPIFIIETCVFIFTAVIVKFILNKTLFHSEIIYFVSGVLIALFVQYLYHFLFDTFLYRSLKEFFLWK